MINSVDQLLGEAVGAPLQICAVDFFAVIPKDGADSVASAVVGN